MIRNIQHPLLLLCLLTALASFLACDDPIEIPPDDPELSGTGVFTYSDYPPLADKPLRVYYHIPAQASNSTPILFVFHGGDRNGAAYRDEMIAEADQYGFMVFAPEFSSAYYPGGDAYNLGNVFEDGDNPSPASLQPENIWTFSVIEPLYGFVKAAMKNTLPTYDVLGHSAGAQFAHRLMMLRPDNHFGRIVASAAGWYTVPDPAITFPYGSGESPIAQLDQARIFARELIVLVGEADNDPDAPGLRRNSVVDQQGDNRLDRAQHFYQRGEALAGGIGTAFNWRYKSLPGVAHDFGPAGAAAAAMLYP